MPLKASNKRSEPSRPRKGRRKPASRDSRGLPSVSSREDSTTSSGLREKKRVLAWLSTRQRRRRKQVGLQCIAACAGGAHVRGGSAPAGAVAQHLAYALTFVAHLAVRVRLCAAGHLQKRKRRRVSASYDDRVRPHKPSSCSTRTRTRTRTRTPAAALRAPSRVWRSSTHHRRPARRRRCPLLAAPTRASSAVARCPWWTQQVRGGAGVRGCVCCWRAQAGRWE
jgi:hypothetical protein